MASIWYRERSISPDMSLLTWTLSASAPASKSRTSSRRCSDPPRPPGRATQTDGGAVAATLTASQYNDKNMERTGPLRRPPGRRRSARWADPAFPRAFPWFGEARYWEHHVLDLAEQGAALIDDPTGMG